MRRGHNVLYTFPVWKAGSSCGFNDFGMTSFSFQFYGPSYGGDSGCVPKFIDRRRLHGDRNMIIICGMVDVNNKKRPCFPPTSFPWTWSSCQDIFCGTIVLSRSIFLERWLLEELSIVNCRTTFIPIFDCVENSGRWKFELVTLEGSDYAEGRSCEWRQESTDSCQILLKHQNKEAWTYNHSGDSCKIHNGGYNVSCE
jgi:hypothetical protein